MRFFDPPDVANGAQRDLRISASEFDPGEKITVSLDNVVGEDAEKYVRLCNVIVLSPEKLPANPRVHPKLKVDR